MFSKMQKWEQVANFELYVTLELRAEVGVVEIVQTTTSLQFAVLDDRCTTLGGKLGRLTQPKPIFHIKQ